MLNALGVGRGPCTYKNINIITQWADYKGAGYAFCRIALPVIDRTHAWKKSSLTHLPVQALFPCLPNPRPPVRKKLDFKMLDSVAPCIYTEINF